MALNTHGLEPRGGFVTVDRSLHELGSSLTIRYRSDWSDDQLRHQPQAETLPVQEYPVTARKDDAPAAYQAAITNLADLASFSGGGGLIQTTSG